MIVGGIDPARDQDCQVQREVEILNLDTLTVRNGEEILHLALNLTIMLRNV